MRALGGSTVQIKIATRKLDLRELTASDFGDLESQP
jgi:hypothetical protein